MPWTLCVKINHTTDCEDMYGDHYWANIKEIILDPMEEYIKSKTTIHYRSTGHHNRGKSGKPHIHCNYLLEDNLTNFTKNYQYFYIKRQKDKLPKDLRADYKCKFFKEWPHSVRRNIEYEYSHHNDSSICGNHTIKGLLAYPYKEATEQESIWKVGRDDIIEPFTQQELIQYGTGLYLAMIVKNEKKEKSEEQRTERWSAFCEYMDELREHPAKYEMTDLRGVCLVALEHFRSKPERTSVNAVISMCKDYAFKRNIWTNSEILDKYCLN